MADFHKTCRRDVSWAKDEPIQLWDRSIEHKQKYSFLNIGFGRGLLSECISSVEI